jgi:hypothetical protein
MPAEKKIAPNIQLALDYSRSFAAAKPNIGLTEKEHIEGLANLLERTAAENQALQELLNQRDEALHDLEQRRHAEQQACQAAERRVEQLETVRASLVGKVTRCKECGSDDLFWYSHIHNHSTVQHNRLNTNDVTCLLILGCNNCSETLMTVKADRIAERMTAALKPIAEAESYEPKCKEGGEHGPWSDNYTYCITCGYYDKSRVDD